MTSYKQGNALNVKLLIHTASSLVIVGCRGINNADKSVLILSRSMITYAQGQTSNLNQHKIQTPRQKPSQFLYTNT